MKRALPLAAALVLLFACGGSVDVEPSGGGGTGTGAGNAGTGGAGNAGTGGVGNAGTGGVGNAGTGGVGNAGTGGVGNAGTGGVGNAGTGGSIGGGGTGGAAVCAAYGDACTECLAPACPATWCACRGNPACIALSTCLQTCHADAPCEQSCQAKFPSGISDLYLVSDCAGTYCGAACPGNEPLGDCSKCIVDSCPDTFDACLADAECVALYKCFQTCGANDLVCQQGCYAQHGAGTAKLQALLQCESGPCTPVCQ